MSEQKLKTVSINGKNYVMVNERLKYFREKYPDYGLVTSIVDISPERVCMEAKILSPDGNVIANGHAFEEKQSSYINKTSYIENCETSAWGRALANFGIGIDDSVGSADEVAHAMNIQNEESKENPLGFIDSDAYDNKAETVKKFPIDEIKVNVLESTVKNYNDALGKSLTVEKICRKYGVENITDLNIAQWKETMDACNRAIKEVSP